MKKPIAAFAAASIALTGAIVIPATTEASAKLENELSNSSSAIKEQILAKLNSVKSESNQQIKSASLKQKVTDKVKTSNQEVTNAVKPPTQEELAARTGLDSNNDIERRAALEKKFGIKLNDKMVWEDKKGQTTVDPDGIERAYTSHDELKSLGIYATNANRQELIQYGIETDIWYPYRAFEAQYTPGYFKVIDGKHEYTKVYYANQLANYKSWLGETEVEFRQGKISPERYEELKKAYTRDFNEALANYKKAPGVAAYIIGVNNTEELAAEHGVEEADFEFFEGVNNHEFMQGLISEEEIRSSKTTDN